MCLSKVYLNNKSKDNLIFEEVCSVIDKRGVIEIDTMFGKKKVDGYSINTIRHIAKKQ